MLCYTPIIHTYTYVKNITCQLYFIFYCTILFCSRHPAFQNKKKYLFKFCCGLSTWVFINSALHIYPSIPLSFMSTARVRSSFGAFAIRLCLCTLLLITHHIVAIVAIAIYVSFCCVCCSAGRQLICILIPAHTSLLLDLSNTSTQRHTAAPIWESGLGAPSRVGILICIYCSIVYYYAMYMVYGLRGLGLWSWGLHISKIRSARQRSFVYTSSLAVEKYLGQFHWLINIRLLIKLNPKFKWWLNFLRILYLQSR